MTLHPTVAAVTDRIRQRSAPTRSAYLARLEPTRRNDPQSARVWCCSTSPASVGAGLAVFESSRVALIGRHFYLTRIWLE